MHNGKKKKRIKIKTDLKIWKVSCFVVTVTKYQLTPVLKACLMQMLGQKYMLQNNLYGL